MVATTSLKRERECASHHAIGVPTINSRIVVSPASSSVSRIGCHNSAVSMHTSCQGSAIQRVTVLFDDGTGFVTLEKFEEGRSRRVVSPPAQQHGILADGLVQLLGNHPARTRFALGDLTQCNQANLGVAGSNEL